MKIKSHDEFDLILKAVANELVHSKLLYQLYVDLNSAFSEHLREINQSPSFWMQTRSSIFEAAMIRLCRVYDHGAQSNGLPRVLQEIKSNPDFFDEVHFRDRLKDNEHVDGLANQDRRPNEAQLDSDMDFCDKSSPLVGKLLIWRNAIFAHKSVKLTITEAKLPPGLAITYDEISELQECGLKIANRYSDLFRALSYSTFLGGHDDYKYVFKCLRDEETRGTDELRLECEKYGIPFP